MKRVNKACYRQRAEGRGNHNPGKTQQNLEIRESTAHGRIRGVLCGWCGRCEKEVARGGLRRETEAESERPMAFVLKSQHDDRPWMVLPKQITKPGFEKRRDFCCPLVFPGKEM